MNGRPSFPPPPPSGEKVQKLHDEVNEVGKIARNNIQTVLKRDDKLKDLEGRSNELQDGAILFKSGAIKLKRKVSFNKNLFS